MQQQSTFSPIPYPEKFHPGYGEAGETLACDIIDWMNINKKTLASVVEMDPNNLSRPRVSQLLGGKYPSKQKHHLTTIQGLIKHSEDRKNASSTDFCDDCQFAKLINHACKIARRRRRIALVTGDVGTGKTRTLYEYAKAHPGTILIESLPRMSAGAFVDQLIRELNISMPSRTIKLERRFIACLNALKNTETLIIIDEADKVSGNMLEHARRILDLANVGIVLAGTNELDGEVKMQGGHFDQIRSRVTFATGPITAISKEDALKVINNAFAGTPHKITTKIFEAFWTYCQGSMRVLTEDILPNVIEGGLRKPGTQLTPELITKVCKTTLNF